jgi:nucleotidyltransferase/DNA polymerase involved in DNA repair
MLLYAAVPDFYAEAERAASSGLATRPVIVGGDPRKRGLVQSATADARAVGVAVGMSVVEALERCPRARALRTDMRHYRDVASRLRACFRRLTDRVEPAGLDAAFLEPAGRDASAELLAEELRERVRKELRLPLQVGIAPVKFLAKLAAEASGTKGVLRIEIGEVASFLAPLPVTRLPGVGAKTAAKLSALSVHTVGELARLSRPVLEEHLGNHGLAILGYAQGRDETRLRAMPYPRSLSQELTLDTNELDRAVIQERILELAQRLEASLALERLAAKRVTLKLRYADHEQTTRSRTVVRPVSTSADLAALASELLDRTQVGIRPIRLLGLAVASLVRSRRDDRQLDLFPSQR